MKQFLILTLSLLCLPAFSQDRAYSKQKDQTSDKKDLIKILGQIDGQVFIIERQEFDYEKRKPIMPNAIEFADLAISIKSVDTKTLKVSAEKTIDRLGLQSTNGAEYAEFVDAWIQVDKIAVLTCTDNALMLLEIDPKTLGIVNERLIHKMLGKYGFKKGKSITKGETYTSEIHVNKSPYDSFCHISYFVMLDRQPKALQSILLNRNLETIHSKELLLKSNFSRLNILNLDISVKDNGMAFFLATISGDPSAFYSANDERKLYIINKQGVLDRSRKVDVVGGHPEGLMLGAKSIVRNDTFYLGGFDARRTGYVSAFIPLNEVKNGIIKYTPFSPELQAKWRSPIVKDYEKGMDKAKKGKNFMLQKPKVQSILISPKGNLIIDASVFVKGNSGINSKGDWEEKDDGYSYIQVTGINKRNEVIFEHVVHRNYYTRNRLDEFSMKSVYILDGQITLITSDNFARVKGFKLVGESGNQCHGVVITIDEVTGRWSKKSMNMVLEDCYFFICTSHIMRLSSGEYFMIISGNDGYRHFLKHKLN